MILKYSANGDLVHFREALSQLTSGRELSAVRGKLELTLEQSKFLQSKQLCSNLRPGSRWTCLHYALAFNNGEICREILGLKKECSSLQLMLSVEDNTRSCDDSVYGLKLCMACEEKPFRIMKYLLNEQAHLWSPFAMKEAISHIKTVNSPSNS
jgi:ankyrin repeat protein